MTQQKKIDVAFLGLARNCEAQLMEFFNHVESLKSAGLTAVVIIGEDGSTDLTRSVIAAQQEDVILVDTSTIGSVSRLEKMARARELVLKKYSSHHNAELVCVIDLDGDFYKAIGNETLSRIREKLLDRSWFAVSASSKPYYDLLAFESPEFSFAQLKSVEEWSKSSLFHHLIFRYRFIHRMQHKLAKRDIFDCTSAFNGICVYRGSDYATASYIPKDLDQWICEHVTINRTLSRESGRVYVDKDFLVGAPREHVYRNIITYLFVLIRSKYKTRR